MLYYLEVRWLSRGRVLRRFYELLPEIYLFLHSQNKAVPELIDPEWKWEFAFLTDITEMLNSFNLQLQGQGKLICHMYFHKKAFKLKLKLLLRQVKNHNFIHLSAENPVVAFLVEKCVEALKTQKVEFGVRFRELHVHAKKSVFFRTPLLPTLMNPSVPISLSWPSYRTVMF